MAPSKAQEGGRAVATGSCETFSHPVLPELLRRTWKAASTGSRRRSCRGWGLPGWGVCLHRGPGLFLVAQSNPPESSGFSGGKVQRRVSRGGVGARLTLGRFPSPQSQDSFSSGLSSTAYTRGLLSARLCPSCHSLPPVPLGPIHQQGMVSHQSGRCLQL